MKVFKFGGASVKDAEAVKNVADIIRNQCDEDLLVVVSAMGKMTNALELVVSEYFSGEPANLESIRIYHDNIVQELELDSDEHFMKVYHSRWNDLIQKMATEPTSNYDYEYDQIVSFGEILSTTIISGYLNKDGVANEWLDARKIIRTDNNYREGKVDWEVTEALFKSKTGLIFQEEGKQICLTQGFIGHTDTGQTTTLGREGSDFSAGIAAWCLGATEVVIWKDVPGMLNADPKFFNNTERLPKISFREAIELSYYGASVIHPKTIKPLQNKGISLLVKSFKNPKEEGTIIQSDGNSDNLIPSYIFKEEQILVSISPKDFSFIVEQNLRDIFNVLDACKLRVNLMQNSAISFSVCMNYDKAKIEALIAKLDAEYLVKYNTDLSLMTIRHYTEEVVNQLTTNREILLEQRTRHTTRFVLRS